MEERQSNPVLQVKDLSISFSMYDQGMAKHDLEVIHQLSLTVRRGEILAVAGSSGSGKSLLAHGILGILPKNAKMEGEMAFCGQKLEPSLLENLRGKEIAFIPQSVEYLDPLMKVGKQVIGRGKKSERIRRQEKMKQVFERYHLEPSAADLYPYQLSGGMARRVLIAGAVLDQPKLMIADEPTPGLQEELARETIQNFRELAEAGCGVLLITHDIDLAMELADRIAVFYGGTILEIAPVEDFSAEGANLRHPYSRAFLQALPQNEFCPIKGSQPYAGNLPKGCLFADRCPYRREGCQEEMEMRALRGGEVRCRYAE
ncbi:MAG: ABC transporter ATP-binding protein [Lachnospiraceae bacterium]|nr:ABC transporter ATP-binding protein [Lachnospiraceae bacterium]